MQIFVVSSLEYVSHVSQQRQLKQIRHEYLLTGLALDIALLYHTMGVCWQDWHLYVGMAVNILSLTFPLLRTAVSKECPKDQIGAVFAGLLLSSIGQPCFFCSHLKRNKN